MAIVAGSNLELIKALDGLPSDVGSRLSSRDQEKKENYALKNYGKILQAHGLIRYPISINKQESPDYWINEGGNQYGIEITESTSEAYQMLLTEWEKRPGTYIEPSKIQYGRNFTPQEILSLITPDHEPLSGPGWGGTQAEGFAANWARDAAEKKLLKVKKWTPPTRTGLRILLYQNCPGWIHNKQAFTVYLSKNIQASIQKLGYKRGEIQIDYLLTEGETLIFDAENSCQILEMPPELCRPGKLFRRT